MALPRHAALLVLFILGAGCLAQQEQGRTGTETASETAQPTTTGNPLPPLGTNATYPKDLILTDCVGWDIFYDVATPPSGAQTPPGWGPALGAGIPVGVLAFECQRISFGPFERGPIRLVMEAYSYNDVPENCQPHNNTEDVSMDEIRNLWIADDALVSFLLATFPAFPVHAATITASNATAAGNLKDHVWSWAEKGKPPSEMHVLDEGSQRDLSTIFNNRFFWFPKGSQVSWMDFHVVAKWPQTTNRPDYGKLMPPNAWADVSPVPDFAGIGHWFVGGEATGHFEQFGDLQCKQPL